MQRSKYCPQLSLHPAARLTTALICAARQGNADVISLLIQHGADADLADDDKETPLFFAENISATQELLRHGASVNHENHEGRTPLFRAKSSDQGQELLRQGANVNHRDKCSKTALFDAIAKFRRDLVQFLISNGADVNVYAKPGRAFGRWPVFEERVFSPLQQALRSFFKASRLLPVTFKSVQVERLENYFEIIKLIVPLCSDFTFRINTGKIEPCVVQFFKAESKNGWHDPLVTKYLLRHGARADFSWFYDCIFSIKFEVNPFSEAFLKLVILAGCKFDKYFSELMSNPRWQPAHPENESFLEPVQKLVMDLFSQPLSLQELSVMAIRKCICYPQLWAKIDALPVPILLKDNIKLKTYSGSGTTDFDFKCPAYAHRKLHFDVCTTIL